MCKNYVNPRFIKREVRTKMVYYQETNILVASQHLIYGSAMVVSSRIIHLLSHKPPRPQTVLGLVAIDAFSSQIAYLTSNTLVIGSFHDQFDDQVSQVLLVSNIVCFEWPLIW